jgi:hypothetical protein
MKRNKIPRIVFQFCVIFSCLVSCTLRNETDPAKPPADLLDMSSCLEINPSKNQEQTGYRGILPGLTPLNDLEGLVGLPVEKSSSYEGQEWDYGSFLVIIPEDIITEIYVYTDPDMYLDTQNNPLYLRAAILKYGCPDVILAAKDPEALEAGFEWTILAYHNTGLEIRFFAYPLTYDDIVTYISYFAPSSLLTYTSNMEHRMIYDWEFISWDDAIH